jgi:hypothetical protein
MHLLGLVELYGLAVYAHGPLGDRMHLASPDVSKALRIEVTYKEDLRRRIDIDWRREMIPALDARAVGHLRGPFGSVRQGDVVMIEYVPGQGTAIRINRTVVVSEASHDLILAFLDHWLGQRPLSEEMKRTLLAASRPE